MRHCDLLHAIVTLYKKSIIILKNDKCKPETLAFAHLWTIALMMYLSEKIRTFLNLPAEDEKNPQKFIFINKQKSKRELNRF